MEQLTGMRTSYVDNSEDFCNEVRQLNVFPTDIIVSYDAMDHFTGTHILNPFDILTLATGNHILTSASSCTKEGNYFRFQDSFFLQNNGAPMGSILSPFIAEVFMEPSGRQSL
ncbi:hypothetical protein M514_06456, partial [Trichuris suis]